MRTMKQLLQESITPEKALELLQNGNKRFVNNLHVNRNLLQQVNETSEGQFPFSVILSCIDSRTSAELVFDQGLGDIFSIRIAGNILNEDILGSMEYACKVVGAKLIVVLGHTKCGAVQSAADNFKMGNITSLLSKLKPAIDAETTEREERNSSNHSFISKVSCLNVKHTINQVVAQSPILMEMVKEGKLGVVGGMYDIDNGSVEFFEDNMILKDKISF